MSLCVVLSLAFVYIVSVSLFMLCLLPLLCGVVLLCLQLLYMCVYVFFVVLSCVFPLLTVVAGYGGYVVAAGTIIIGSVAVVVSA